MLLLLLLMLFYPRVVEVRCGSGGGRVGTGRCGVGCVGQLGRRLGLDLVQRRRFVVLRDVILLVSHAAGCVPAGSLFLLLVVVPLGVGLVLGGDAVRRRLKVRVVGVRLEGRVVGVGGGCGGGGGGGRVAVGRARRVCRPGARFN